jgi:hypothetical protein
MSSPADQIVARLLTMMPPVELLRVVEMEEAERLSSLSAETLMREHTDKVIKLSARRNGMRMVHALMLREINAAGAVQGRRRTANPKATAPPKRRTRTNQSELPAE